MDEVTTILVLGVFITAFWMFAESIGIDPIILWLSEGDKWWSPFRKMPSGGHIHFFTKGWTPGGDFAILLYGHIPQWHYHPQDRQFYKEGTKEFKKKFPNGAPVPSGKLHRLGVGQVGFARRLYKRNRQWEAVDLVKPTKAGEQPSYQLVAKETKPGEEHIFYFSTTMGLDFGTLQTKSTPGSLGTRVTGKASFNALMVNPVKAEFVAGKWEIQTVGAVRSRIREHVTSKTPDELRAEKDTIGTNELVDALLRANKRQKGETGTVGLIAGQGIQIDSPRFEDYDVVEEGGDKEVADSMRAITIARNAAKEEVQKARQARVRGIGKRQEREEEAQGIVATVKAWGSHPVGAAVVTAQAIETSKPRFISLNQQGTGGVAVAIPEEPDRPTEP